MAIRVCRRRTVACVGFAKPWLHRNSWHGYRCVYDVISIFSFHFDECFVEIRIIRMF